MYPLVGSVAATQQGGGNGGGRGQSAGKITLSTLRGEKARRRLRYSSHCSSFPFPRTPRHAAIKVSNFPR